MNYLLDTNAWLRLFMAPEDIKVSVLKKLQSETSLALSPISLIEVAQKNARRQIINIPVEEWFKRALPDQGIILYSLSPQIAATAYQLGEDFHGDPADRIIAATSLVHDLVLVTSDRKLLKDPQLQTMST